ncbi:hypothetical protein H4219_000155 [Mycoemilia scoparia]|uniref:Uncharacterized protein n=1 Tax=Mycoemilia scoparia TaxID=417184 RepID=A0A9W8ABR6_9FUNG|nr:hypothetical protein H4219_000155 [Mycoemilia scoparia]
MHIYIQIAIFQKPAPLSKEQDVLPHEPKNDTSISARDDNSTAKLDTSVRLDLHNIEENVKAIEQYLEHTNVHIESNVDTSIHIKADIPNKLKLMIICELGDSNEQLDTTGPKLSISGPYEDITFQDSSAFQVFNAIKEQFNELFGQIGKCMTVGDLYDILVQYMLKAPQIRFQVWAIHASNL